MSQRVKMLDGWGNLLVPMIVKCSKETCFGYTRDIWAPQYCHNRELMWEIMSSRVER